MASASDAGQAIADLEARVEHRVTRAGRHRVQWRVMGRGRPLILLHGGYGSWLHWLTVIAPLAEHCRVACPDMPGFAHSDGLGPKTDPPRIAAALNAGADSLFGDRAAIAVAGFSFGGLVAGHLAASLGPRARFLGLIGSGGLGSDRPALEMKSRSRGMSDAQLRTVHRHNLAVLMLKDPRRIDDLAVEIQYRNTDRRPAVMTAVFSRTSALGDVLPKVGCPVQAIWGDSDATVGPYRDRRIATLKSAAPHADVAVIPDCGHWVMFEQPQAFIDVFVSGLDQAWSQA